MSRRIFARIACIALLCCLPAAELLAGQVTEHYEDGSVRAQWAEDDQGRRNGGYAEFHENGRQRVRATYRRGKLHGTYNTFHENGKPSVNATYKAGKLSGPYRERDEAGRDVIVATYVDGKLDGRYEAFRDGEPLSVSDWDEGRVLTVDGVLPFPKSQDEIRDTVEEIFNSRDPLEDDASDEKAERRGECLRLLKIYRYLCDVEWRDCRLDERMNEHADAASALCERIGRLDHTPENPGMPEDEYEFGYKGTSSSNLFMGGEMEVSVRGYMDDSDAKNIARVGHRRWCINPPLQKTGFGSSGKFAAMWSMDSTRKTYPDFDFVSFPPRGYMPVYYFGEHYAWSVSLNPKKYEKPTASAVRVNVYALDDAYVRRGEPLELTNVTISSEGIGLRDCIIFKPTGLSMEPGDAYWVEVTGLERKSAKAKVEFLVEFMEL